MLIVAGAIASDVLIAYGTMLFGFSFKEIIGDLMLIEVAILFVVAGLIDFSSSIGAVQLRKSVLRSKQDYSQAAHKEAEKKAAVLVVAGVSIFAILMAIAVLALA